jgi:hypothetical protein
MRNLLPSLRLRLTHVFPLAVLIDALAHLAEARAEVTAARVECPVVHEKLEEKKKTTSEFEQRANSAELEVAFLRKELNTTLTELSTERLRSAGFSHIMRVHARDVFNDFRQVYEELGAALHSLELEGEGLFDRWAAWLRRETTGLPVVI